MFIEFDCGCIGFDTPKRPHWYPGHSGGEGHILIYRCDTDYSYDNEYGLSFREVPRNSKPLDADRTNDLIVELIKLIDDGYRFRDIKRLLK